MRWDGQQVDVEQSRQLPGYRDPAVIRTFDAPEALDTRFYEVRAKSALNRVPERSRMPFRWTVNPYRGCSHACTYCAKGDTPVLMADGRTKPIADLRPGDLIYGTIRTGAYRRYELTQVIDQWSTIKPAFRVTLEDGTELVTSGDHRFLTNRGWKHVTGTEQGAGRRPHLTLNDKLIGLGAFPTGPDDWPDFRRGYLCGLIRGDAHLASYDYPRASGSGRSRVHRFRLALTDLEALHRAKVYLEDELGIITKEFAFASPGTPMRAIRTQARDHISAIHDVIRWPRTTRPEWCKGYLAGIFDAEGSYSGSLRITNTDGEIIAWTAEALRVLGFAFTVEDYKRANGLRTVRLLGGLPQAMKFFLTVDPAITRKRWIEGTALKSNARLRVMAIEPLGKGHRLYDITTGTGDFIANGVVSHNCFARPTHKYLDLDAGRDFEREIVVKVNVPEVLRAELARPRWAREHVALGTNTDPYQWVEGRYRLMPGIWEAFRDTGTPASVLTKSPLLLRDLELMRQVPDISAALSVPTLEEKAWRSTEPHTPHPRARLEAVGELNRAGIPTSVLIAPLMPGVNDSPEQVERILELAAEAGAVSIGGIALHLRGEVKGVFFDWLRSQRPDLLPLYERLYAGGAYAPPAEQRRLAALVRRPGSQPGRFSRAAERRPRPAPPEQPRLF